MRLDRGQIEIVDDAVAEALRRMQPWERLAAASRHWEFARDFLISHLAASHPEWSPERVREEVASRIRRGSD